MQLMRDPNGRRFTLTIASRALFNLKFTILPVSANTSLALDLFLRSSGKAPQPGLSGSAWDHSASMQILCSNLQQPRLLEAALLDTELKTALSCLLVLLRRLE